MWNNADARISIFIISLLSLKGIGPKTAAAIVSAFGEDTFRIIEREPDRLTEISGIGPKTAARIGEAFREQREFAGISLKLQQYGIGADYALRLYQEYGADTISILEQNPYQLIDDFYGIGFVKADRIAEKIGLQELDRNALVSLEIMSADGRYNNAAALLADANRFPGIDVARFGSSISVILSRHTFAGISVLTQMDSLMALFDEHYVYEKIVGVDRVTRESVPREAFREALANALVHRTWDVGAHVKVSMFQDRIEVSSPGGLPQGITEDEYLAGGLAIARNPILANVFFRLGYIERFGTGIPRILQEYAECDVYPSFIVRGASIAVTLPVVDGVSFDDDERAVLGAVPKGSSRTRSQIAQDTGMSKDKSIRVINRLVDRRMLAREGAGRSVRYSRM
jgi:predicted HTH transcriptional regulator